MQAPGHNRTGIIYGFLAALLFGAATPLAKALLSSTPPLMLAALFYCGSGFGLFALTLGSRIIGRAGAAHRVISKSETVWLSLATLAGGVLAPVAMMQGLSLSGAASGSMLLNLEGVFTAALAWLVFKENVDRRIFTGMIAILLGGCVLSFTGSRDLQLSQGSLLIALACLLWAADNNLCRKLKTSDSTMVAMVKGLVSGIVNLAIAFACHLPLPSSMVCLQAVLVGFFSYGLSLVCYLKAQRFLGTARTGAYFASAPFVGVVLSVLLLHETPGPALLFASVLMALGLWLHLTEVHTHMHIHEAIEHCHEHVHATDDPHHQHVHEPGGDTTRPHTHMHRHERLVHEHSHYPDSDHEHSH